MPQENTKAVKIVRQRTTAGCLIEGWRLLADNIWSLLRLSWPLIAASAILGLAVAMNQHPDANSMSLHIALAILAFAFWLIWLWYTAVLVRHYNAEGALPATTMLNVWKADGAKTAHRCIRQMGLIVTSPRHWPALAVVVIVAMLVKIILALLFVMPCVLTTIIYTNADNAIAIGDTVNLPAYIKWLYPLTAAVGAAANSVLQWVVMMPMAFFVGKIKHERTTSNTER